MRRFLPFATLLGVAFLLGCQDPGSGPVGLEPPQFDKSGSVCAGHCPHNDDDDQTKFKVTLQADCATGACDVTGEGFLLGPDGKKEGLQQEHNVDVFLNLSSFFQGDVTGNGTACFGTGQPFSAGMQISQEKPGDPPGNANIQFFFKAEGTDNSPVNYVLQLLDGVLPGNWPAVGGASTITGGKFNIGQSNGPGRKVACTATDVALLFSIKVERCTDDGVTCPTPF